MTLKKTWAKKIYVGIFLAVLLIPMRPVKANTLYSNDFESSDLTDWTGATIGSNAHEGTNAANIQATADWTPANPLTGNITIHFWEFCNYMGGDCKFTVYDGSNNPVEYGDQNACYMQWCEQTATSTGLTSITFNNLAYGIDVDEMLVTDDNEPPETPTTTVAIITEADIGTLTNVIILVGSFIVFAMYFTIGYNCSK